MAESEARQRGVVVTYNAERGFGFIRPQSSEEANAPNVYFHIRHIVGQGRPRVGQQVNYRVRNGRQGLEAVDVRPGFVLTIPRWKFGAVGLGLVGIFFAGIGVWLGWPRTPGLWLGLWMLSASVATFILFGFDKKRAQVDGERVPEVVLKGMSVGGGWVGGLSGMRVFHHKTRHKGFLAAYWPIYLLEASALVALLVLA